ncbi:MAG TPA: hypothetical protein VK715_05490 [Steroidobacteraceae bacterium]|nr:hypothetical protein [Steroidobacteraceae bacterium]
MLLKLMPELELELKLELELELEPVPPTELGTGVSVPNPLVPSMAAMRVSPKIGRTGRGTVSAMSCTIMRIPNSISRERFSDSSVRSAEMRAAR